MKLFHLVLFLPLLLCLPVCPIRAEEIYKIDAAMQKADPRLAQRVTLTETRLPLGALLERLSAKTGVSFRMDTASTASEATLRVVLHDSGQPDHVLLLALNRRWGISNGFVPRWGERPAVSLALARRRSSFWRGRRPVTGRRGRRLFRKPRLPLAQTAGEPFVRLHRSACGGRFAP